MFDWVYVGVVQLMKRPTVKHNQGPGRDYNADNEVFLTKVK